MRVLLMVQRLWQGGGTETHVLTLAQGLRQLGHSVTVYTSGGRWVQHARSLGIPVHVDPGLQHFSSTTVRRFRVFIQHKHFHVVHVHDGLSMKVAAIALRPMIRRPKLIFTVHGLYVGFVPLLMARHSARAVIAVSSGLRPYVLRKSGMSKNRVVTVQNGIQTEVFRPRTSHLRQRQNIPQNAFVIGYASRFTADKTLLGLRIVNVLRHFSTGGRNVYVLVAGRNSQHVIANSKRLRVLGHVRDMQQFYNACDVVIGTARVAAESVSCGVPTLALGLSGLHGFVTSANVRNMIRTNFGDHGPNRGWNPAELRAVLRRIERHPLQFKRALKKALPPLRQQLSARRMVKRVLLVYQRS